MGPVILAEVEGEDEDIKEDQAEEEEAEMEEGGSMGA